MTLKNTWYHLTKFTMNEEILSIIEKNLPAQVGKKLQERLALIDSLESEIKELNKSKKSLEENVIKLKKFENLESELMSLQDDLKKRELKISKRELEADTKEAVNKAKNSEEKVQMMNQILSQVFRSPVYKREGYRGNESFSEKIDPNSDY